MPSVAILLSTCNGARYLPSQIDSILSQSSTDWALLIRDDGSTDNTLEIIAAYSDRDSRISLLPNTADAPLGPKGSFATLIEFSLNMDANYFFLCDQDDQWLPDKVSQQVQVLQSEDQPALVYSSLELVDEHLNALSHEAAFANGSPSRRHSLAGLLSQNSIPGCTIGFNRLLAEIAVPIPDSCVMHDWWLSLVAAASGEIFFIERSLIKYRQHSNNQIGGQSLARLVAGVGGWPLLWRKGNAEIYASLKQAGELSDRLEKAGALSAGSDHILRQYQSLAELTRIQRLRTARRLGLRKGRPLQQLVLYLRLLGRMA